MNKFDSTDKQLSDHKDKTAAALTKLHTDLHNIRLGLGLKLESYAARWLDTLMKVSGIDNPNLKMNQWIKDPQRRVHKDQTRFEVDVISYEHAVVLECTTVLRGEKGLEKLRKYARKCRALETDFKRPFKAFLTCYAIDEEIKKEALEFMRQNRIRLIPNEIKHL